ncbi:MAG: homoserine dehydrogenase [Alphaproteobacteria bacterium]|nr:homoserine dehydrogenase [Alphaproteobacteria bacterium]
MSQPLRVALAGLGTVGAGTVALLAAHGALLERRCGRRLLVTDVSARSRGRDRGVDLTGFTWHDDPVAMARRAEVDVIVELIGGADGVAKAVCEAGLAAGRHVVTANKALLAKHGTALARSAEAAGLTLAFEASVAGGIPIVKALREGLAANELSRVYGILNGTCNYILTTMRESGREFADVLAEAQRLGFAEADPAFDIDGIDAAHKLAVLASVAFGVEVDLDGVHIEGIGRVSAHDIRFADELGYRIKLLGIARRTAHGIEQRVHPCMVKLGTPIAHVDGVFNAVVAEGDFVGSTVFQGRGAGAKPTASAVVSDLIDIARGRRTPTFSVAAVDLAPMRRSPMARHVGAYYLRLMVIDRPGVFGAVAVALGEAGVSIESVLQRGRDPNEVVPVVMITHDTEEQAMLAALERIAALDAVVEPPTVIRIETL